MSQNLKLGSHLCLVCMHDELPICIMKLEIELHLLESYDNLYLMCIGV
jgi:hypothetical protein